MMYGIFSLPHYLTKIIATLSDILPKGIPQFKMQIKLIKGVMFTSIIGLFIVGLVKILSGSDEEKGLFFLRMSVIWSMFYIIIPNILAKIIGL